MDVDQCTMVFLSYDLIIMDWKKTGKERDFFNISAWYYGKTRAAILFIRSHNYNYYLQIFLYVLDALPVFPAPRNAVRP